MIARASLLLLITAAAYAAPPCTAAKPECTEWIVFGGGPARSLVYRTHPLDTKDLAVVRALVVVHGMNRDADNYFQTATAAAFLAGALEDTVVIAPRFASAAGGSCRDALAPNEVSWPCGIWRSGGAAPADAAITSFDLTDEILRTLASKKAFPNLKTIVVAGPLRRRTVRRALRHGKHDP